jgi:hypothetical protein
MRQSSNVFPCDANTANADEEAFGGAFVAAVEMLVAAVDARRTPAGDGFRTNGSAAFARRCRSLLSSTCEGKAVNRYIVERID